MKTIEIEGKIPDYTNLATKAALNAKAKEIENKIPDTTSFITTPDFKRLTKLSPHARMKEAAKIHAIKIEVKNTLGDKNRVKMKKLETFDASHFIGRNYFGDDGSKNHFIFPPVTLSVLQRKKIQMLFRRKQ